MLVGCGVCVLVLREFCNHRPPPVSVSPVTPPLNHPPPSYTHAQVRRLRQAVLDGDMRSCVGLLEGARGKSLSEVAAVEIQFVRTLADNWRVITELTNALSTGMAKAGAMLLLLLCVFLPPRAPPPPLPSPPLSPRQGSCCCSCFGPP